MNLDREFGRFGANRDQDIQMDMLNQIIRHMKKLNLVRGRDYWNSYLKFLVQSIFPYSKLEFFTVKIKSIIFMIYFS